MGETGRTHYPALMRARSFVFASLLVVPFAFGHVLGACSSETDGTDSGAPSGTTTSTTPTGTTPTDGASPKDATSSADASATDANPGSDASCADAGKTVFGQGDTCAPFGEGSSCTGPCLPKYGYVCTGGGPANLTGCIQVSDSTFGGTYCCPTLSCVRMPGQDAKCAGKPGGTKLYSCPVDKDKNLRAQPGAGCQEVVDPTLPEYRYYCCPS
jgi:hypothetical protein